MAAASSSRESAEQVVSFCVVPFHIVPANSDGPKIDPFDDNYNMIDGLLGDGADRGLADFNRTLMEILRRRRVREGSPQAEQKESKPQLAAELLFDDQKYHDFVQSYIYAQKSDEQAPGFGSLRMYNIRLENLVGDLPNSLDPVPSADGGTPVGEGTREVIFRDYFANKQKAVYRISDGKKGELSLTFSFLGICIFVNEIARTGYMVIQFAWDNDPDPLACLAQLDFFRFFRHDPKPRGKYVFTKEKKEAQKRNPQQSADDPAPAVPDPQFSLYELIDVFFRPLHRYMRYYTRRPTMLHVSVSPEDREKSGNPALLKRQCYNILRIPPKGDGQQANVLDAASIEQVVNLRIADEKILFCDMSEGVVVIDTSLVSGSSVVVTVRKYFPAFILALNQRETMGTSSRVIAEVNNDDLLNSSSGNDLVEKLGRLKKLMTVIQMKQVFYSISFFHEVEEFFSRMQQTFDVETLLKDNRESIEGIHKLLEQEAREREEIAALRRDEETQKRERLLGMFFSVLSLLSVVSALTDGFAFLEIEGYRWVFYPVITVVVVVFIWLIYYNRRKPD